LSSLLWFELEFVALLNLVWSMKKPAGESAGGLIRNLLGKVA
jgi:hypothetical protein